MTVLILKNSSATSAVIIEDLDGLTIDPNDTISFSNIDNSKLRDSVDIIHHIAHGEIIVSVGGLDLTPSEAINAIRGITKQVSTSDDGRMFVVNSNRPKNFFAYYTSRGDDIENGLIGKGPVMTFDIAPLGTETKDFYFTAPVLIEEGNVFFENASIGTSISFEVIAPAGIPFQTPGVGTLDLVNGAFVPNAMGTGAYSVDTVNATIVNRHVNEIQLLGTGSVELGTPEPGRIPPGYAARLVVHSANESANLKIAVQMMMFRERTV